MVQLGFKNNQFANTTNQYCCCGEITEKNNFLRKAKKKTVQEGNGETADQTTGRGFFFFLKLDLM